VTLNLRRLLAIASGREQEVANERISPALARLRNTQHFVIGIVRAVFLALERFTSVVGVVDGGLWSCRRLLEAPVDGEVLWEGTSLAAHVYIL
jgi:hypothetical protein